MKMDIPALHAFMTREFPQVHKDFRVEQITADGLIVRLITAEQHLRPGGTISGPTMFALADVGMYLALLSRIGPVALAVTTNCAIDFMRKPASGVDLLSETRILKLGRSLAVGDVLLYSDGGRDKPVAHANLTYAIPPSASQGG